MIIKEDKKIWKKALLKSNTSIIKAIESLNNSSLQIVLVVSKGNKFIGTITDGDIRRGFIKGLTIKSSINKIINKKSLFVSSKINKSNIIKIMNKNEIRHLPILSSKKILKGLYVFAHNLTSSFENTPIVIMAGGKGKRLMPLTKNCPKPLIKINGKPILEHIILKARDEGFKNFFISIYYLGDKIKKYFSSGKKLGVSIKYLEEKSPLGTAGSLNLAKSFIKTNFLVINGDILSIVKFSNLLNFHKYHKAEGTMTVRNHEIQHPFGVVKTKGVKIKNFEEKPILRSYVNAGVYAFTPAVFKFLKKNKGFDMPEVFERLRKNNKKTIVFPIHESWVDLGDKSQLNNKEKFLDNNF